MHCFLTMSLSTISPSFVRSIGTAFSLFTFNISISDFNLFQLVGAVSNLFVSNLSISDFRQTKSSFLANDDKSMLTTFYIRFCCIVKNI